MREILPGFHLATWCEMGGMGFLGEGRLKV